MLAFGEFERELILTFSLFMLLVYLVVWDFPEFVHCSPQLVGTGSEVGELLGPPSFGFWHDFHRWNFCSDGFLQSFREFLTARFHLRLVYDLHWVWGLVQLLFELSSEVFPLDVSEV